MLQKSTLEDVLRIIDPIGNQMAVRACLIKPLTAGRDEYEVPLAEIECMEFDVLKGATIHCRHGMEFLVSFRDGQVIQQFQTNAEQM